MTSEFEWFRARRDELKQRMVQEKSAYTAQRETIDSQVANIRAAADELAVVNKRLADMRRSAKQQGTWIDPTKHIRVSGFKQAHGVSEALVRHVLSSMPPRVLAEIQEVKYSTHISADRLGSTDAKPQMIGKPTITLYPCVLDYDEKTLQVMYTKTLFHETGHVLFERFARPSQRLEWSSLFMRTIRNGESCITEYADTGLREDVAECFMFYHMEPTTLYDEHRERYTFIDKLYKEVSK